MKSIQYYILIALTYMLSPAIAELPKLSSFSSAQATVLIDFDHPGHPL
jgi:hypothetical protein